MVGFFPSIFFIDGYWHDNYWVDGGTPIQSSATGYFPPNFFTGVYWHDDYWHNYDDALPTPMRGIPSHEDLLISDVNISTKITTITMQKNTSIQSLSKSTTTISII